LENFEICLYRLAVNELFAQHGSLRSADHK